MLVFGLAKHVTSQRLVAPMTSNHHSQNLVRVVSAEVICIVDDKEAKAIYSALRPDMYRKGQDVKIKLVLKGEEIHFEVSSADLGIIKAFLTSYLKLIGAASSTIKAVSI